MAAVQKRTAPTKSARAKQIRQARGWSKDEVAVCAGISIQTYNRVERGELGVAMVIYVRVALALGTTVAAIMPVVLAEPSGPMRSAKNSGAPSPIPDSVSRLNEGR